VCAILAEKCILAKHSQVQCMPVDWAVLFSPNTDDHVSGDLPKKLIASPSQRHGFCYIICPQAFNPKP
jgi:hypothetical protein